VKRSVAAALTGILLMLPAAAATAVEPAGRVTLLVAFDRSVPSAARAALHARAGAVITGTIPEIALDRVSVPRATEPVYAAAAGVHSVERPRLLHVMGRRPNDPLVSLQWGLPRLDVFKAWKVETGKRTKVPVGVIDTGIDATHVDLKGRVSEGFDFLETDDDPYDDHGHGTHVAGIIAANVGNREGIAGVSQGARIIPMKTCEAAGTCPIFETYLGVIDAVRRGALVLNMSLGGPGECSFIDQSVFDWVHDQGVLTVVAAGNSGHQGNPPITPASCDHTLAVGASDQRGRRAVFSSYGSFVDVSAPGVDIWSTLPPLVSIMSPHIGYAPWDGTSMAAPFVAGAASLLKAHNPDWSPDQIQQRLMATAVDAGKRGRDDSFGKGIVNLFAALRKARSSQI
jgi:subtilisin family serine protease